MLCLLIPQADEVHDDTDIPKADIGDQPDTSAVSALFTKCGSRHSLNQDRALLVSPFHLRGTKSGDNFIIGVFDGHGDDGEDVAEYAAQNLPTVLASTLEQQAKPWDDAKVTEALTTTFRRLPDEGPPLQSAGSTASIALRIGDKLYLANAGDSFTFVAMHTDGITIILKETKSHTTRDPIERARIEQHGGNIDENHYITPKVGKGALNMTRSLGDRDVSSDGVIPDPTVTVIDANYWKREGALTFVASVTDGISDVMPLQEIATEIGRRLSSEKLSESIQEGCECVAYLAVEKWKAKNCFMHNGDDVTIVVHML